MAVFRAPLPSRDYVIHTTKRDNLPVRLAILGAGGHARETALVAERSGFAKEHIAFVVEDRYARNSPINGICVHTFESGACDGWPFVAAVGDPALRERLVAVGTARGMKARTLCDATVRIDDTVHVGAGCLLAAGAIVTVNLRLGLHVHLNVGCSISHDCDIGDYCTVSPGARIAGHVHLGRRVFVGIGATIVNGSPDSPLVIGDDVFVAAGACVIGHVPAGSRVAGVPAKAL
jgi:sugar O-acyltransferase (sialic acid O-acetyltransferase NeuD family)